MRLSRFCSGLELMSKFFASSSSAECPASTVSKLDICQCMLGCFGVSIIHQTRTWTAESLTSICDLFVCIYTLEILVYGLSQRTFVGSAQNLTLEKSLGVGTEPSTCNSHLSTWRPLSVELKLAFESKCFTLCRQL